MNFPFSVSPHGEYPLYTAIHMFSSDDMALCLLESSAKPGKPNPELGTTPLMLAAMQGRKELVGKLLEKKIKIDARDIYRETALFKAVCSDHLEIVDMLLEKGANPDVKVTIPDFEEPHRDEWGDKPLTVAVWNGSKDMVKLLLETGRVNVNHCCDGESTNIQIAIRDKNETIIKMLMDAGADLTKITHENRNSLHFLAETRSTLMDDELAKMLIEAGCDVSLVDNNNVTPLLSAVHYDKVTLVKRLVQANAPLDLSGNAINVAMDHKHLDIACILIKAGCDISIIRKHNLYTDYRGEFINWLKVQVNNPRDLKVLCRIRIRKLIGITILEKLSTLNLSNNLTDFLILAELDRTDNDYQFPKVTKKPFLGWPKLMEIWEHFEHLIFKILPSFK